MILGSGTWLEHNSTSAALLLLLLCATPPRGGGWGTLPLLLRAKPVPSLSLSLYTAFWGPSPATKLFHVGTCPGRHISQPRRSAWLLEVWKSVGGRQLCYH